jgi:glycosyltransferase involved in cell wall biosynthesis
VTPRLRVVTVSDARYEGGAERYLVRLTSSLDRARFEPVALLPDRHELDALAARFDEAGVDVRRFQRPAVGGPAAAFQMARVLASLEADVAHLNFPSPYELGCGAWALFARAAGARRVVATEHIADIAPSRRRALQKRLWRGAIDRTITISRAHRALLASRHGLTERGVVVIENGVEDPGERPPRGAGPPSLVCVGGLEPRKGQDVLITAVGRLRKAGRDIRLVLVGDGPSRREWERLAQNEAPGGVRFVGTVPDAGPYILAADVLAVPSRIEGVPFVVLEALAAGTVPVVSLLPGLDEFVDDGVGRLVSPGDVVAWEEALGALLSDPGRLSELSRAARRRYLERYTLARMVRRTQDVYLEVTR